MEKYTKDVEVEANTLLNMVQQQVLPAVFEYRKILAEGAAALVSIGVENPPEKKALHSTTILVEGLVHAIEKLVHEVKKDSHMENLEKHAHHCRHSLLPLMAEIRNKSDQLEAIVGDKFWPFPKYTELLWT